MEPPQATLLTRPPTLNFTNLLDPRHETRDKLYPLHDVLMIVLSTLLSDVEDWVGMDALAEENVAWLQGRLGLSLPNRIPSHNPECAAS